MKPREFKKELIRQVDTAIENGLWFEYTIFELAGTKFIVYNFAIPQFRKNITKMKTRIRRK